MALSSNTCLVAPRLYATTSDGIVTTSVSTSSSTATTNKPFPNTSLPSNPFTILDTTLACSSTMAIPKSRSSANPVTSRTVEHPDTVVESLEMQHPKYNLGVPSKGEVSNTTATILVRIDVDGHVSLRILAESVFRDLTIPK